ncbi:DUF3634 family protein [Salinisphaera sp.]|uniref:DUF3634 family protein n=1 Tax=Salinisphaera sp. TaxID=1914330 RepID=UPI002D79976F|nr:DUF3634 family protein [Salinisphaera sp.]HET7312876.1 DUF3634 family protein [Salinisphaera sp.]
MLDRFRLNYRLAVEPDGRVTTCAGRAPAGFVAAVADIVRLHAIERGTIECKGRGRAARLRFAGGFPERGRQAIRNVWKPPVGPGPGGGRRAAG